MRRERFNLSLGSELWQSIFATIRWILLLITLWFFGEFNSINFHGVDPREVAQWYRDTYPLIFGWWPDWFLVLFSAGVNKYSIRYMIPPFTAFLFSMIAGANFVRDVYAVKRFRSAFYYVMASMFPNDYPLISIDKDSYNQPENVDNLLRKIGGPGYALVEPGNAVVFRFLRGPGPSIIGSTHFMAPFETIGAVIDLDEQQGDKDEITALSRDGFKVILKDVHMRYRLKQEARDGQIVRRTIENPYPLAQDAFRNMMKNLTINPGGNVDKWNDAVERVIVGNITDFIAENYIDYLTAPRDGTSNPRIELRNELFMTSTQRALENYGAELLWVDVGHWEIVQESVDDKRADLWATQWMGDTTISKAYSEAIRQAYHDLGRAQAQAELILSIADALRAASVDGNSRENIRRLLLARTAQVLDSLGTRQDDRGSGD